MHLDLSPTPVATATLPSGSGAALPLSCHLRTEEKHDNASELRKWMASTIHRLKNRGKSPLARAAEKQQIRANC